MPLKKGKSIGEVVGERVAQSELKVKRGKVVKDDILRLRIPSEEKTALETYCQRIGSSVSTEVRKMIYRFMEENGIR